jgi:hypothetical protein
MARSAQKENTKPFLIAIAVLFLTLNLMNTVIAQNNATNLVEHQLNGIGSFTQAILLVLAISLLIIGTVLTVAGYLLYTKSKPEQKARRIIGIILLLIGILMLLSGISALVITAMVPNVINTVTGNTGNYTAYNTQNNTSPSVALTEGVRSPQFLPGGISYNTSSKLLYITLISKGPLNWTTANFIFIKPYQEENAYLPNALDPYFPTVANVSYMRSLQVNYKLSSSEIGSSFTVVINASNYTTTNSTVVNGQNATGLHIAGSLWVAYTMGNTTTQNYSEIGEMYGNGYEYK